jgi:aldehyde dehydrogenase (NAD+)
MRDIFSALDLGDTNAGVWSADGGWSTDTSGPWIDSINPSTGELLGRVRGATAADYERVIVSARRIFDQWKMVPAPKRGEAVRLVGDELRKHKSALGSLVTLEVGKIKPEAMAKCRR